MLWFNLPNLPDCWHIGAPVPEQVKFSGVIVIQADGDEKRLILAALSGKLSQKLPQGQEGGSQ